MYNFGYGAVRTLVYILVMGFVACVTFRLKSYRLRVELNLPGPQVTAIRDTNRTITGYSLRDAHEPHPLRTYRIIQNGIDKTKGPDHLDSLSSGELKLDASEIDRYTKSRKLERKGIKHRKKYPKSEFNIKSDK